MKILVTGGAGFIGGNFVRADIPHTFEFLLYCLMILIALQWAIKILWLTWYRNCAYVILFGTMIALAFFVSFA